MLSCLCIFKCKYMMPHQQHACNMRACMEYAQIQDCICIYTYSQSYVQTYRCVYDPTRQDLHTPLCIYIYIYIHMYVQIYKHMCIYIYIYIISSHYTKKSQLRECLQHKSKGLGEGQKQARLQTPTASQSQWRSHQHRPTNGSPRKKQKAHHENA